MGAALPKAVETAVIERQGTKDFNVAVAEFNGWRNDMEDAHLIFIRDGIGVFGVYDGHGGKECSKWIAQRLNEELEKDGIPEEESAWKDLFIRLDQEFLDTEMGSGTTCTMCVVRKPQKPGEKHKLHVINAGDSRTLLGKADGSIVDGNGTDKGLTVDHKPENPDERARIERAGGTVETTEGNVARVNGNLSVCRGFGDRGEKKTGGPGPDNRPVTCIPDQFHFECDETDFILLVCDGVSEGNFPNEEVIELVAESLKSGNDAGQAGRAVCQKAIDTDSKDNITCMVIQLQGVAEPFDRKVELIPGSVLKLGNSGFKKAYLAMAEKAGFTLAEAVAKRYDVVQEELKAKPGNADLMEESKMLGSPLGAPGSDERVKWYEEWLLSLPEEEGGGGPGGMDMDMIQSMLGKGPKGGGKGGKGSKDGKASKGGGEKAPEREPEEVEKNEEGYTWSQKGNEVQILIKLPKAATKKEVKVVYKMASLSVAVHGESVLDGSLGGKIETDECTWCLGNQGTELQVMLTKQSDANWTQLLK